jgi:hypothetical protein
MTEGVRFDSGVVSSAMPSSGLSWGNENPLNCQCRICAWCRWFLGLVGTHQCPCNLFRFRDAWNSVVKWLEHPWCGTLLCRAKAYLEIECSGSGLRVHICSHSSLDSSAEKIIHAAAGRQAATRTVTFRAYLVGKTQRPTSTTGTNVNGLAGGSGAERVFWLRADFTSKTRPFPLSALLWM